nr:5'-methylthioadenosine/adenosylhomocysteine nucleosidase [Alkalibacter rhizosphaerae]
MKVGIIGAMESEIAMLQDKMEIQNTKEIATLTFYEGVLRNKPVVLVRSGIGKVNAAICAQILIDRFGVEAIINSGVAGALHPDLEVGDIVLATEVMQHDIDASIFGDPRGTIPGLKESVFPTDPRLLAACCSTRQGYRILQGRIITGDQAVGDSETKEFLYHHFHGYCVEMEGGPLPRPAT